jgi:DNA-binding NtrC family response regulator
MAIPSYNLLVIEDSKRDALLLERTLQNAQDASFTVTCVDSAQAGFEALATQAYDLILLDFYLPDMDGLAFLRHKQQRDIPTPVIMMTAFGHGPGLPVAALQAGAMDYFAKDQMISSLLSKTIKQAIDKTRLERQVEADATRVHELEETVARLQQQIKNQDR